MSAAGIGTRALLAAVEGKRCLLGPPRMIASPSVVDRPVGEVLDVVAGERPRVVELALAAAREALEQAGLLDDTGCDLVLGTGSGARSPMDFTLGGVAAPASCVPEGEDRFAVVTGVLAAELGLRGRTITINTACSSGANAVVHGWELVRTGRADRVLCVGVEELWAGLFFSFSQMGALSPEACAPFLRSDGTSLAEGAGAVVLEASDAARARGAQPLGSLLGAAQSADAFHISRPDPSGAGPRRAVEHALRAAGVGPAEVDLVVAHGTGTEANDTMEAALYESLVGQARVVATKGIHGHTHGASGILELIVAVDEVVCGRSHLALKTSFAMGGLNTALVVGDADRPGAATQPRGVSGGSTFVARGTDWLDGIEFEDAGHRRVWRRIDVLGRLTMAAADAALRSAEPSDHVGISYATSRGPALAWAAAAESFRSGAMLPAAVIPCLSYNAAPSWACQSFGLRGPTVAYTSGSIGALHAFEHAVMTLELGLADAMLVIAADEDPGAGAEPGVAACLLVAGGDGVAVGGAELDRLTASAHERAAARATQAADFLVALVDEMNGLNERVLSGFS